MKNTFTFNNKIYTEIPNWETRYAISEDGEILSLRLNKIINDRVHNGYRIIHLNIGNTKYHFRIHRLVAFTFLKNPENKPDINHIDGDKMNNHFSNIEWVSKRENNNHAISTGLIKKELGKKSNLLAKEQWLSLFEMIRDGESDKSISRTFSFSNSKRVREIRNDLLSGRRTFKYGVIAPDWDYESNYKPSFIPNTIHYKVTPDKHEEMLALRNNGYTMKEIGNIYGVSSTQVTRILRRLIS